MFYSHEVLTSRKYGVATVWLVATLGSKSGLKKVSRKAILDVDVQKACETIEAPRAPMALRLQSTLLYGVSRVYAQQCGYVLNDVESAKNHMHLMFKILKSSVLDNESGNQARADQLMLQDDPNFFPDLDLAPLDLDQMNLNIALSQGSTLSPHNSQLAGAGVGIGSPEDVGGLVIPASASSLLGGPVGGGFSMRGDSGAGSRIERQAFLDDDLGLVIDEDGNLQMTDAPPRQPAPPLIRGETTAPGGVGSGIGLGSAGRDQDMFGQADDDMYIPLQDDFILPPDDQDAVQAARQSSAQAPAVQQQITSEGTVAPQRRKRTAKTILVDANIELRNNDLARWQHSYVGMMQEAIEHKEASNATAIAKKNAEIWMLGEHNDGPLSRFSGAKLLEAFTGTKFGHAGDKRPRQEDDTDTDRRVRSRGEPSSDEVGRGFGFEDDGYNPIMDDTIEQGREAPTPLDDRQVSSIMPWNMSGGSQRRAGLYSGQGLPTSASIGGAGGQLGLMSRRGSRLTSASPLIGRAGASAGLDDFQIQDSDGNAGIEGLDEFELFGPAAQVDTQTAELSQWQRTILDGESMHFLEFVQTGIREADETRDEAAEGDGEDEALQGSIDFDVLLPPETHSRVVAAQGLLHVLSLGTKNLLAVEQGEAFGPITLRAVVSE